MRPAVRLRLTAAAALGVVLAGCGTVGDMLGSDAEGGLHTAKIVVLVPAEGKQADAGAAVLAAVRLAVSDAGLTIPGWTVEVAGVDGGADAGTAAEVAAELASDEDMAAVVGGLSAQVVRAVQPVLAGASILFVSPADVAREHTRGADPARRCGRTRPTSGPPSVGGDAVGTAANYAVVGLGASRSRSSTAGPGRRPIASARMPAGWAPRSWHSVPPAGRARVSMP